MRIDPDPAALVPDKHAMVGQHEAADRRLESCEHLVGLSVAASNRGRQRIDPIQALLRGRPPRKRTVEGPLAFDQCRRAIVSSDRPADRDLLSDASRRQCDLRAEQFQPI